MRVLNEIEITIFLEALRLRHGYDFTRYARASLRRRLQLLVTREAAIDLAELLPPLLRDPAMLPRVLSALLVPVTEGFRDAAFFITLREQVLPILKSYPEITVWLAGCAGGEEAYSMAILLHEAGLLDKTHIYGTDINEAALSKAEDGVFSAVQRLEFANAYRQAGGTRDFADYCQSENNHFRMAQRLRQRISFAHHNLTSDGVFCEAHLILCRNVLIYFDRELQNQALSLFTNSLIRSGYLCLGLKEDIRFSSVADSFETVADTARIYRKKHIKRVTA